MSAEGMRAHTDSGRVAALYVQHAPAAIRVAYLPLNDPPVRPLRSGSMQPRRMVAIATVVGIVVTLGVALSPVIYFAYDRPQLHLVLETAEAFIALLIVCLLTGRVRETRRVSDVVLVYAMAVLGMTNLMATLPHALLGRPAEALETWVRCGPGWSARWRSRRRPS